MVVCNSDDYFEGVSVHFVLTSMLKEITAWRCTIIFLADVRIEGWVGGSAEM